MRAAMPASFFARIWAIPLRCRGVTPVQWRPQLFLFILNSCYMDYISTIRAFLTELITPIVVQAVKDNVPEPAPLDLKKYITVEEAMEQYGLSMTSVYRRFNAGVFTKVKNGSRTLILREEIEDSLKRRKVGGTDMKAYNRNRNRL